MLHIENLCAGYGDIDVIHNLALDVMPNEVVGVLGCNGAGKTTLVKAIMGLLPRMGGQVAFLGQPLTGLRTHEIARRGIGLVPQGRWIFPKLSVRENLLMGTQAAGGTGILDEVFDYFPVLKSRLSQQGGTLSGGEQQVLAISRALCGRPKLLLLDEPSDGVQPNLVERIGEVIPELCRRSKLAVLLVEQNLDLVLQSAQRCIVLSNGRLVHAGAVEPQPGDRGEHPLARYLSPAAELAADSPHENLQ
ncbi:MULTISPECIES: ABC transporter ATP-binding protein [Burkholderia cepacia complex]|uniref:High-affinity branched-chain amino acid transport ATP-binding protein LivF n=1 Tax=Burkholderia pseudomultivorans TaxID=1207504 RepID=A0ABU2E5D5_9BURK|nr:MULTISPECIES: ABC transporter ATP-binding protein [Burkholderia cepacia complex]MDN8068951.1 ABC transporter ATP-binding protein [Burkholderia vietnamiensis]MDR8730064.1 High-affinity branched-chain amino acid transport ATP-binding protein LivF [Burkholderia pseudomultivorans]MDR8737490.1 High-affinity branched-chain amino acid transport ATP-binding protein LivF [Burkholderia pseudomultivorans]MDR8743801.1 High-affinity branched-chain amino acid transport ATP-binding protein LivF [Burkholder